MAPQIVLVYRGPGRTVAAKRCQAGAKGAAKKKANARSKSGEAVESSAALPNSVEARRKRSRKAKKPNEAGTSSVQYGQSDTLQQIPQQQQFHQPVQARHTTLVPNKPLIRKPSKARRPIFGRKALAVERKPPSSPSLPAPVSPQHGFSSSASTLVASNPSTPALSPTRTSNVGTSQAALQKPAHFPRTKKPEFVCKESASNDAVPTTSHSVLARLSSVLTSIDGESLGVGDKKLSKRVAERNYPLEPLAYLCLRKAVGSLKSLPLECDTAEASSTATMHLCHSQTPLSLLQSRLRKKPISSPR